MASRDLAPGLDHGPDGAPRCWWATSAADYTEYHDAEWGYPVGDDARLFEKLCLEGFQSGLSWLTILRRRPGFRAAFHGFDIEKVARMDGSDVDRLLQDRGIIRHRGKIEATLQNARAALEIIDEHGSLAGYVWRFEPSPEDRPRRIDHDTLLSLTQTPASRALARDLKDRGFRFVGPTTAYAFMQAMGLVNDHLEGCSIRPAVTAARDDFEVPT
ncbi:MAG: DNA-3-methyladenine glycosylase I [Actinobacteria bacterium]|nr:DNA-3-methyladenine glycosylase I [Actinomycetota bacterium]